MTSSYRRILIASAAIPPLIILIVTVIMPTIMSYRQASPESAPSASDTEKEVSEAPLEDLTEDQRVQVEQMRSLEMDRIFWQSRLELAKTDSFYLVLDLVDSVLIMEIKGVAVRRCAISSYDFSPTRARKAYAWPSELFTLNYTWATIPKAPIRIQHAPKDSASIPPAILPGTTDDLDEVTFFMEFSPNLSMYINPDTSLSFTGWMKTTWHRMAHKAKRAGREALSLIGGALPQPNRQITLTLSPADVKAIYRALPAMAPMIIRI